MVIVTSLVGTAKAQNGIAISSDPGKDLHVALNWRPKSGAVKYNIYRKNEKDTAYPATPLNKTPVQVLTDCAAIKAQLIPSPDSAQWKLVAKALSGPGLFNPCDISKLSPNSEKYQRLITISRTSTRIAIAAGLGYKDKNVVNGLVYFYKIVALNASGRVLGTVAADLKVTAGSFTPLPAPANVVAEPGDAAILVRWDDVPRAAGYILERATSPAGTYKRVNESYFSAEIKNHLNGDTLIPSGNGMLDFKRYTVLHGKDSTHVVKGITIDGPKNRSKYYYRVKAIDLFGRTGGTSPVVGPVIPADSTKPAVPTDIAATPDDNTGHVNIRWTQVVKDINGHWEYPDSSIKYKVYRFAKADDPDHTPSVYLGQFTTTKGLKSREITDADPALRGEYGNKTWWYRLRAVDLATNISQWSTAVSAVVKDITPPAIVKNVATKGFETYIAVKWELNPEPDMASYVVYRSLCHLGSWIECKRDNSCKEWSSYDPNKDPRNDNKPQLPCPCSGPFVFLGEITKDSANRARTAGNFFFEDRTIPAGSPLCYAYWIKAKDSSDNVSGSFPLPSAAERNEIKCERLHDLTPPEPAIISGLFAQAEQVRVEWIGPPTQDTRAYHVYRAEGTNPALEPADSAYAWVGGTTIELPPTLPKVLDTPYKAPALATCDKISVQATPWMSAGFFEDKSIRPKLTYWYKVVGIDYDGNETPLDSAAAISTFSFTRKIPDAPVIEGIGKQADPCSVILKWSPAYDSAQHLGFIVYRSTTAAGPFIPVVVSPVTGNSYVDTNVVAGTTYWYRVALLLRNGRLSAMSGVQSMTP